MFRVQNHIIRFSCFPTLVRFRPRKVVKIRTKYCSTVLTRNDNDCTQTLWVCFGCKIELSRLDVHFPCSRHVLVVSGPEKVIKTRLKHFSVVLMENGKNCTLIIVGMFQVQNGVIRARFSTSPTPGLFRWCLDREESSKLD